MKIRTKVLIGLLALGCISCTVAACATDKNPYPGLEKDGYSVSIRYDSNGGQFLDLDDIDVVHNFTLNDRTAEADGSYKIQLIEPGDDKLDENNMTYDTKISRTGYFLAGWYKYRILRFDASGNPVDDDGNICDRTNADGNLVSASGKVQGYEYSGKWDFDTDRLIVDAEGNQSIDTLYAAWVPEFKYSFMVYGVMRDNKGELLKDENGVATGEIGWYSAGEYKFDPLTVTKPVKISLPEWKDGTGKDDGVLNMKNFEVKYGVDGKTFLKAYEVGNADGTCSDEYEFTGDIEHFGDYDRDKAVSVSANRVVYTTWRDGNWFHIRTAEQLIKNAYANGCYELYGDLEFDDVTDGKTDGKYWPAAFTGTFSGKFVSGDGKTHSISNVSARQNDNKALRGGIFGEITAAAVIEKVNFVNAKYICSGSLLRGAEFGLFAGHINEQATISEVTISGQLILKPSTLFKDYGAFVGIFSGNAQTFGVDTSNVTCTFENGSNTDSDASFSYTLVNSDGEISVTYEFIGF